MAGEVIHVVFKTHLDIGFTDHAEKVRAQYHERFIPQAIDTGAHFFAENPEEKRFIWTTGAWLIWDHLNSQPPEKVKRLEQAIERGLIVWHALPFTTHTELMSPALVRAGLSYAAELDERFGRKTIAAKMTDVPGHTRGLVPLLAEAGVKFLHLGVNTASPVPDVPEVFRWRTPDGAEVVVMYQNSYGATHLPEGISEGLSFAHTSDNIGPQSVPQTNEAYREIAGHNPGIVLKASTLDAYGELLWARRESFPVVDVEIGDSWIHGSASDPAKTQRFLALGRVYDRFVGERLTEERLAFGRGLAMVAEHTCGVDIKSYLRDEMAWDRGDFEKARKEDYRFAYTEASWAEQRGYLDAAVDALTEADRAVAEKAVAETWVGPAAAMEGGKADGFEIEGWRIGFDGGSGDVTSITAPGGAAVAGGPLLGFSYESYDAEDVKAHLDTYLTHRAEWAILDHDKPGLRAARTARSRTWRPKLMAAQNGVLRLAMPEVAHEDLGAPESIDIVVTPLGGSAVEIGLILRGKPANRMPEAGFLTFAPDDAAQWEFQKLGLWQDAERIARRGGGQLQAVTAIRAGGVMLAPLDTPLAGPAGTRFMPFNSEPPDFSKGVRFNLFNNKWGTNFPMWWEGDLKARFVLTLG